MEELVIKSSKGNAVTTSRLIAQKFGKRHSDVMRAIKNLEISEDFRQRNFALVSFSNLQNPSPIIGEEKYYVISKDGFSLLVMGFTGKEAIKFKIAFIEAFNRMEEALRSQIAIPKTFSEALELAAKQAREIEEKERIISKQAPKVLFAESVEASEQSVLVSELAKILKQNGIEIGQNRLFEWLRKHGYLCSKGSYYNQPTQRAMELKLFEIKMTVVNQPDGKVITSITPKVTGKGLIYFVQLLSKAVA